MDSHEGQSRPSSSALTHEIILRRALNNDALDIFDKSVIEGIFTENQDFAPDGKYYDAVSDIIITRNMDKTALFNVGVEIGSDICRQTKSAKTRTVKYLNAVLAMEELGVGLVGRGDAAPVMGLRHFVRMGMLSELAQNESLGSLFTNIDESLRKAVNTGDGIEKQYYERRIADLWFISKKYDSYVKILTAAKNYDIDATSLDGEAYETLKSQAMMLSQEAMRQRKYGTKPAYIEASFGGSWIFYDGEDWVQKITRGHSRRGAHEQYENIAAVVNYSQHSNFKSLQVGFRADEAGNVYQVGELAGKIDFELYIGKDGRISTDPDGLEDIGLELNLSHSQELALRAEIVSNFWDLSMPVTKNRPDQKVFSDMVDRRKKNFNPIQKLLIPRVRYIETNDEYYTSDDITRTVREHDVVWYVRVLPTGWHASPEAAAEAEAHGVELADNETFVKAHTRGSKNKVLGYHAVRHSNP